MENEANQLLHSLKKNYQCHQSNLKNSGAKNIAWTSYDGNQWSLKHDNYTKSLVQDAGMCSRINNVLAY